MSSAELLQRWGIDVRQTDPVGRRLHGGISASCTLHTSGERRYVLREAGRYVEYVRTQCRLIVGLGQQGFPYALPTPLPTLTGDHVVVEDDQAYYAYEYLPGSTIPEKAYAQYLPDVARLLGAYHRAVRSLLETPSSLSTIRTKIHGDIGEQLVVLHRYAGVLGTTTPHARRVVPAALERLAAVDLSQFFGTYACLPRTPCHGDLQGSNLITDGNRLRGLIDFGGIVSEPHVFDVQGAIQHVVLSDAQEGSALRGDVSTRVRDLAQSFEGLTDTEREITPQLMLTDLVTTLAWLVQQPRSPRHDDLIAERWALLQRLVAPPSSLTT